MKKTRHLTWLVAAIVVPAFQALAQQQVDWKQLASVDLKTFAVKLGSAGIPRQVADDIICGEVERRILVSISNHAGSFWELSFGSDLELVPALEGQLANTFYKKKMSELQPILGTDGVQSLQDRIQKTIIDARFAFVNPDKRAALSSLKSRYDEQIAKSIGFPPEPSELEQATRLREELDAKLTETLTADEKREYDLRYSSLASKLRGELATFRPTEQESGRYSR